MFDFLYSIFGTCLRFFYELLFNNYLLAIIVFTLITKFILLPTSIPQQKNQARQYRMQPKIKKIQQKFGGDRQKMNEEQQALYNREGYNPLSAGCGPMLVSLPLLWGVYGAITRPLSHVLKIGDGALETLKASYQALVGELSGRAAYASELGIINKINEIDTAGVSEQVVNSIRTFGENFTFLGISLTQTPSFKEPGLIWLIPILSALSSFAQSFITSRKQKQTNPDMAGNAMSNGCMMVFMPLFSLYICFTLPAGVGVYWVCSNIVALVQTIALNRIYPPQKVSARNMIRDVVEKRSREESIKLIRNK